MRVLVAYSKWSDGDDMPVARRTLLDQRRLLLAQLLLKVEDAPPDWFISQPSLNGASRHRSSIETRPCSTWAECEAAWRGAMFWRRDLADAMVVLLAVCASTKQAGNQLFLDLIGSPGSAKTTLCRGLLTSQHCIHLENITKFISGFKMKKEDGSDSSRDCSFIARANGKTLVTCEFDTIGSSGEYNQLMGKARRIFDGETSATYGNSDEDRVYTALRTPWIRAGTPKMLDHDQTHLGDRFLRFILGDPGEEEKRAIARRALRSERAAVTESANCTAGSLVDAETRLAHSLTGGYVDWLRAHAEEEIARVDVGAAAEDLCIDLAELSADLRARPQRGRRDKEVLEPHECKELPTRLARQNVRLATCLAVVLNRRAVDADVLRIVRKVALDTCFGHSLNIVQWLCSPHPMGDGRTYQEWGGIPTQTLASWCDMTLERGENYLVFLRKIGVVEWKHQPQGNGTWALTERVCDLYHRVMRS